MIFAKNFARNYEKNNTWNIRRLVNESFVPANQQTSVSYCRLKNFLAVPAALTQKQNMNGDKLIFPDTAVCATIL